MKPDLVLIVAVVHLSDPNIRTSRLLPACQSGEVSASQESGWWSHFRRQSCVNTGILP